MTKQTRKKLRKILNSFAYHKENCNGLCLCKKGNYEYALKRIEEVTREEFIKNIKVKV